MKTDSTAEKQARILIRFLDHAKYMAETLGAPEAALDVERAVERLREQFGIRSG